MVLNLRKSQRCCRQQFADTYYGEMTYHGVCRFALALAGLMMAWD